MTADIKDIKNEIKYNLLTKAFCLAERMNYTNSPNYTGGAIFDDRRGIYNNISHCTFYRPVLTMGKAALQQKIRQ